MKYMNAKDILPDLLVKELQEYIQGGYIYIPANEKQHRRWGEVSALLGITEPAMFGVTLKLKYPFYAAIIGSGAGSAYCAATKVLAQALGAAGIPGFISMKPEDYLNFAIGLVISMSVSALLTIIFWKKFGIEAEGKRTIQQKSNRKKI